MKISLRGKAMPSAYGKRQIARAMYHKGRHFLVASVLLNQKGGYQYVVLHLLCQGVEIVLKSLLLLKDFDKYERKIEKKIGHDLEKAVNVVIKEFRPKGISNDAMIEIQRLNEVYKTHVLRYGDVIDLLVDPSIFKCNLILRKILAVMKVTDKHLHFPKTGKQN